MCLNIRLVGSKNACIAYNKENFSEFFPNTDNVSSGFFSKFGYLRRSVHNTEVVCKHPEMV